MAWIDSGDVYGDITMDLVGGYLADRGVYVDLVSQHSVFAFQGSTNWDNWPTDDIYQHLGDAIRHSFCAQQKSPCIRSRGYCEAWLLNPEKGVGSEFELKHQKSQKENRRLLITLHYNCKVAKECLGNVLEQSRFDVTPKSGYRDYYAFRNAADKLFETIATPFLAPCIIAKREIENCGYRCFEFGR